MCKQKHFSKKKNWLYHWSVGVYKYIHLCLNRQDKNTLDAEHSISNSSMTTSTAWSFGLVVLRLVLLRRNSKLALCTAWLLSTASSPRWTRSTARATPPRTPTTNPRLVDVDIYYVPHHKKISSQSGCFHSRP